MWLLVVFLLPVLSLVMAYLYNKRLNVPPKPRIIPDSEKMVAVEHKATIYAGNGRRLEVKLHPKVTRHADIKYRSEELMQYMMNVPIDFKHSEVSEYGCEFCGKPARETHLQHIPRLESNHPEMVSHVHMICSLSPGPCLENLKKVDAAIAGLTKEAGGPDRVMSTTLDFLDESKVDTTRYPLARSCAKCNSESEEEMKDLKRCTGCTLTRYCGPECQKVDYKRHKIVCKVVTSVQNAYLLPSKSRT